MLYFLGFLLLALVLCGLYAVIVLMEVPGLADERLGRLEPLPPLDEWIVDESTPPNGPAAADGPIREMRVVRDTGSLTGGRLVQQVRFRDPTTDEIVRVEPDRRFRRRRVRSSAEPTGESAT